MLGFMTSQLAQNIANSRSRMARPFATALVARRSSEAYSLSMRSQWSCHASNASSASKRRLSHALAFFGGCTLGSYSRSSCLTSSRSAAGLSAIVLLLRGLVFLDHLLQQRRGVAHRRTRLRISVIVHALGVHVQLRHQRVRLVQLRLGHRISPRRGRSVGGGICQPRTIGALICLRGAGRQPCARYLNASAGLLDQSCGGVGLKHLRYSPHSRRYCSSAAMPPSSQRGWNTHSGKVRRTALIPSSRDASGTNVGLRPSADMVSTRVRPLPHSFPLACYGT